MAPVDGAAEGALALRQVPTRAGQDGQPMIEARENLVGREDVDPCRSELDRERQAIEPPADGGDGRGVLVVE